MWKPLLALIPAVALAAQDGGLTLESLYHPARKVEFVEPLPSRFFWRPDGTLLEERLDKGVVTALNRIALTPWESRPLLDREGLAAALGAAGAKPEEIKEAAAGTFTWNPARDAFIAQGGRDLFWVEPATGRARRLAGGDSPEFSPDGAWVAFLAGNDIHAVELASGREVEITSGGDGKHLNGRLDWLYQEEVFNERDNPRGFRWSPDSRRIAYLSLDESQVPTFSILDDRTSTPRLLSSPYPLPGDPIPSVRLGVATLEGQTTWMEAPYPDQEVLVPRLGWTPGGQVVAHFTDRVQGWVDCRVFTGTVGQSLVVERSRTWVEHLPLPVFLKDGRFLWMSSRSGSSHLYLYEASGQACVPLTQGDWDVKGLLGVDEAGGSVFFEGNRRSAVGVDVFRADLSGVNGHLRLLTEAPGTHALVFNRTFTAALDRWSDVDTPPQDLVLDGEGVVLHRIPSRTTRAYQTLRLGRVTFQPIQARDGFPLETMLVLPPGFDPARKYPVFHYVYGGPGTPMVRNAFMRQMFWFQFLAQQGIVTWVCDNRSASGKGRSAEGVHHNLGVQELRDQEDGLEWLRARKWADMDRIALHGYSYGGYLTAYALTHSKAWKLGILGAPVTDWHLYDCVYTERYMGLPRDNPKGYEASSPLTAAAQLKGKVMLLHGTLDTNVHSQNTTLFLDALQKAGLGAPVVLLPGSDHSPRAPQHLWAMYSGMWEFLKANL